MSLETLLDSNSKSLNIGGKQVEVNQITIGMMPKVMTGLSTLTSLFTTGTIDLEELANNWEKIVKMLSAVTKEDKQFIEALTPVDAVSLLEALYDVNKDGFFLIQKKLQSLETTQKATGSTRSKRSSVKATA